MKQSLFTLAVCATSALGLSPKADAYPIDCAILLCLAGGFPASAECSAAKLEVIRRITPFPIEPPLQLWNCPMRAGGTVLLPGMGPDGLAPDILRFRDGIELYHVRYRSYRTSDGMEISDTTQRGSYTAEGNFVWRPRDLSDAPAWVREAVRYRSTGQTLTLRGVALQTLDHQGNAQIEWVSY